MVKRASNAKTKQIYAVVGSDEAALKSAAAELARKLAPAEAGEFGVKRSRQIHAVEAEGKCTNDGIEEDARDQNRRRKKPAPSFFHSE